MTPRKTYLIFLLTAYFCCLSCVNNPLWAKETLKKEAHLYRRQGFQAQLKGNYAQALTHYKKAVELVPTYAVAYNDLGVIYEKMNLLDKAEAAYRKAIELDPQYTSVYTNLALFYEKSKYFENAARMWRKRIELGDPDDSWTHKAREHLEHLSEIDKYLYRIYEESETLELIDDVKELKGKIKDGGQFAAEVYLSRGKEYYDRGEYLQALRELHRAVNLAPNNKQIDTLLIKAQKQLLLNP